MAIDQQPLTATEQPSSPRYDGMTIALHWLTAFLVVALFALALGWDLFDHGSPIRKGMQSLHISLGIVLAVVIVTRLVWRSLWGRRLPDVATGLQRWATKAMHHGLYLLLVAEAGLGLALRWAQAESFMFFGLFSIQFSETKHRALAHNIEELHDTIAWIIIILAGLHAVAALIHHYGLRDKVLQRMLP